VKLKELEFQLRKLSRLSKIVIVESRGLPTLQTIFHLCIPKKGLAKPHFYCNINYYYDILQRSTVLYAMQPFGKGNNIFPNGIKKLQ
jgi:hypothetical protein